MAKFSRHSRRAVFVGLDEPLRYLLAEALEKCGCAVAPPDSHMTGRAADLVFCCEKMETIENTLKAAGRTPVVVATRLPEVSKWLDALEAGAADYCAAPFETVHMHWLLDRHAPRRSAAAA